MSKDLSDPQKVEELIKLIKDAEYALENPEIYMLFIKQKILDSYSLN